MSPIGVNFGALIALIYSVGVTRAWPLLSYVNTTQGEHADSGGGTFDFDDTNVGHLRQEKVLNFIALPESKECTSEDGRRSGICLNAYECKIQEGVSQGQCALGFGVCCVCKYCIEYINNLKILFPSKRKKD
ncbi:hypothetical protein RUM44_010402 [Polyplax serrata]|uniref:Uncharacterized protein n=1 Tax=Polyplax serrata TaxID=468196 RepID=A0ABR1AVH5_POLSC